MIRITLLLGLFTLPATGLAQSMPASAHEMGCTNCHELDQPSTGPAFAAVAARYQAKKNDPATIKQLVKNISLGSQGQWSGGLPMVANDPTGKRHDQIQALVKFILTLPPQQSAAAMAKKDAQ